MASVTNYDGIRIGDTYSMEKCISEDLVTSFADLSGDYNPVHMDEKYCSDHGLGSRIAHGMLVLSYLSAIIGMHLPGEGSVWLSQSIDFISPVSIGDTVKITVSVTEKTNANVMGLKIIGMKVEVRNQSGNKVARGNVKISIK